MTKPLDNRSALAIAYEWASRIMVMSLVMVLPGVAGYWIDTKLGTVCLFLVIGLAVGSFVGVRQLLLITRPAGREEKNER